MKIKLSMAHRQTFHRSQIATVIPLKYKYPRRTSRLRVQASSFSDVLGLVIASAVPIVGVKAFAASPTAQRLNEKLQQRKEEWQKQALQRKSERAAALASLPEYYGPKRPLWLGPIPTEAPPYLDGTLPGDYGWDPFKLGQDPELLDKYVELEILHARWAMLGALGALVPEVLEKAHITSFVEERWWNVGYSKLTDTGNDLDYLGIPGLRVAGGQAVAVIALCQFLLMLGPEYARATGIEALEPLGIFLPGTRDYPGSWLFDPLGLSRGSVVEFEAMKVREIKNGRLAMVAWLGLFAQAWITRRGLLENVDDWLQGL